jgi:hypothetical protein
LVALEQYSARFLDMDAKVEAITVRMNDLENITRYQL